MERVHYRRDREALQEVKEKILDSWQEGMGYEEMWSRLEEVQDQVLRRKTRKRIGVKNGVEVEEAEWVTEELREGVKKKKERNRKKRNSEGQEKQRLEEEWKRQKDIVQAIVRRDKGNWEERLTKEARESRDRGKTLWKNIRRLQGKDQNKGERKVYQGGRELGEEEAWKRIVQNWKKYAK